MKLLLILATIGFTTSAAQAARVCVRYDVYGNCLQWQDDGSGGGPGDGTGEPAPGDGCEQRVCQIYDVYGNCKQWGCAQ